VWAEGEHNNHLFAFALWMRTEVISFLASIAENSFLSVDKKLTASPRGVVNYLPSEHFKCRRSPAETIKPVRLTYAQPVRLIYAQAETLEL
jgi:hypothetical protein